MHKNVRKKRYVGNFNKDNENDQNIINEKILNYILDDNEKDFTKIVIHRITNNSKKDSGFVLTNYKIPQILKGKPSYASLCAFCGAEKCFNSLLMLFPDGIESKQIKQLDDFKRSLFHFACAGGHLNIIRELEQGNFDMNAKDSNNMTPSRYAAMMGHLDIFKYLWAKGADIISLSTQSSELTTFHTACHYGNLTIAKFILDTVLSEDDHFPHNFIPSKKFLFTQNSAGIETPLHLACEGGHEDIVRYLISFPEFFKLQVNAYDANSKTPIVVACQNGSLGCVQILTETGEVTFDMKKKKYLPLVEASAQGHLDIVKYLISKKVVSINGANSKGITSLHASILNKHPSIVRFLIENRAASNYCDSQLGELFMDACRTSNLQIMSILDEKCKIPYEKVAFKNESEIKWGDKFMQQACLLENEEMTAFLLSKNCNFDHVDLSSSVKKDWSPFMNFLIENSFDLNKKLNEKKPLIVTTIETGNLKRVKKMISMGAVLNQEIISIYNCVFVACSKGKLDLFDFLMSFKPNILNYIDCVKACIFNFAEEQIKDNNKAMKIFYDMIEKLITSQKEDFVSDEKTLVTFAASSCCLKILELFEDNGAKFADCELNIAIMQSKKYLPIYNYFIDHGYKLDKKSSILDSLFCNSQFFDLDSEVLMFLLDFVSNNEIVEFYNYCGNITDVLLRKGLYEALLKIYKKVNIVIMPKYIDRTVFIKWIDNCNCTELIEYIHKFIQS